MTSQTYDIWTIISSISTLGAVIVAIVLSVTPYVYKKISENRLSTKKVKKVFQIINKFLEDYRSFCITHMTTNNLIYRQFEIKNLKFEIQLNPYQILYNIYDDIQLINDDELSDIYYLALSIFSSWPEELIKWYELEARICKYYNIDTVDKKYLKFDKDKKETGNKNKVYRCIICHDDYEFTDKYYDVEGVIGNIFDTKKCPKHGLPMHISFR